MSSNQENPTADEGALFKADSAPKRILLVEDNDLNRQMLEEYLVVCGYQVFSLAGGSGFFQALADFEPSLILLDLKLEDIDGYTLLEQIQQSSDWRQIPMSVISHMLLKHTSNALSV